MAGLLSESFLFGLGVLHLFSDSFLVHATSYQISASGISILTQNYLDGECAPNNGTAAILVHKPEAFSVASQSCAQLSERLWDPSAADFNAGLNSSISTLVYNSQISAEQLLWVAQERGNNSICQGIDTTGHVFPVDCTEQLPALCTQSAPISNSSYSDNSTLWQITHPVAQSTFTGYRDYHTWKFRGLRYAKKPDRFTYSSVFLETGNISAITAGADCVQPIGEVKSGSSEDCLFLNVWTPFLPPTISLGRNPALEAESTYLKPVMVYLYGGGFTSGSGKNPNTDGTNLASRGDAVVVSVNYRVGNVGFLAFPDGIHNGNYAISDMVTALEWVQKYIQYFGGDASRVTLFGESAGAQGTHILLGSPKAQGLFHRAIMQSDPQGYPNGSNFRWMQYATVEDAYRDRTRKVLNETGCLNATDQVACLSKIDGFDLVNLSTNANGAVVDGIYLQNHELVVNKTGIASNVSIMTGTNRDESGVLIDADAYPQNGTSFSDYFREHVGNGLNLADNYSLAISPGPFSLTNFSSPEAILNASLRIASDGEFTCFDLAKAYSGAKHKAFQSTYVFQFNRTYNPSGYTRTWCDAPKTSSRPHGDPDGAYYKCHAGEQTIVFGNVRRSGQIDRDGFDVPFSQLVVDYWSSFARTGNPNPDKAYLRARDYHTTLAQVETAGPWEPVHAEQPTMRVLQWNGMQVPFVESEQCKAIGIPLEILEK
ncbi:uncharacterized protein JN550_004624 [Neoarthrinium moseri]|uniref:uncharacterized protein n=1 Tax=Neoarthrinium moseri TaxID=1658444 RepID=UPI001FDD5862|nr:uncharacterized protein JN550_004624 [Neoarthrinium moseri]KAI1871179.1 hypothetical protein JN550_004624 [Neoarthrinium moseri]